MTTEREITRALQSWLHEDGHEDADRVLDLVLDAIDTTPQRRRGWPMLEFSGTRRTAVAGLAAAVLIVASLIGLQMLRQANTGTPPATPSPTVTATPSASPSPLPAAEFPLAGTLATGAHTMTRWGVPFTFNVPASGWTSDGGFWLVRDAVVGDGGAAMLFWNRPPVNVYSDPCNHAVLSPPAGASMATLAAAMSAVPGTDLVAGPTDVTVGGRAAKRVSVTIREDIRCAPTSFYLWYTNGAGTACVDSGICARYASALGSTITVWIVDVNGVLIVIEGETYTDSGPAGAQEIQQIVDSIRFG